MVNVDIAIFGNCGSVNWDNTPLFVKYNPGLLDLLVLLDKTSLQTGL
jgi:hypothetical protein